MGSTTRTTWGVQLNSVWQNHLHVSMCFAWDGTDDKLVSCTQPPIEQHVQGARFSMVLNCVSGATAELLHIASEQIHLSKLAYDRRRINY